jgi:hypothetical protein
VEYLRVAIELLCADKQKQVSCKVNWQKERERDAGDGEYDL